MCMKSEQINEIAAALVKFQAAVSNPSRSREVEVKGKTRDGKDFCYKFKYAPLDAIIDHIREPLTNNGLAFVQGFSHPNGATVLDTIITHESGQWIQSSIPLPQLGNQAKDLGAAITYTKRYALTAALGIAAEEDNDNRDIDKDVPGHSPSGDNPPKNSGKFHGPLGITELKAHMRAFAGDLARKTDLDELDGFLNDNQEVLQQCERDLPDWYYGKEGEGGGCKQAIDAKRAELQNAELENNPLGAG